MGADLFGSFAEATCAALIISSTSPDLNSHWTSLMFPLLISAVGIFYGILTAIIPTFKPVLNELSVEKTLKNQLVFSTLLTTLLLAFISFMFLPAKFCVELSNNLTHTTNFSWDNDNPSWCNLVSHNYYALIYILCGLYSGLIIGFYTEYITNYSYQHVKEVSSVSTEASLEKMINPGLLIVLSPIFVGFIFGVNCLSGYLTGNIICSVQLAISLSNSGGAWDNSKK
jgi:inorganic pyrophosphatase